MKKTCFEALQCLRDVAMKILSRLFVGCANVNNVYRIYHFYSITGHFYYGLVNKLVRHVSINIFTYDMQTQLIKRFFEDLFEA